ncbi:hypothetical protein MMN47_04945 [Escherichia coli]|nr:hypothetical protein [Escherichia coli]
MGNTNDGNDCQRTWLIEQQSCLMVAFIFSINNRINTALCIHSNE